MSTDCDMLRTDACCWTCESTYDLLIYLVYN